MMINSKNNSKKNSKKNKQIPPFWYWEAVGRRMRMDEMDAWPQQRKKARELFEKANQGKESEQLSSTPSTNDKKNSELETSKKESSGVKDISYYQTIYVRQGKSGSFRDSEAHDKMMMDIYAEQSRIARKIFEMANQGKESEHLLPPTQDEEELESDTQDKPKTHKLTR